ALAAHAQPRYECEQEPSPAQLVEGADRLGQPDEVAPRQQHGGPELEPRARPGHPAQPDQWVRSRPREHLGQPQLVEARLVDRTRQPDECFGPGALPAAADADPHLHDAVPGASASASRARAMPASSTSRCVTKRTVPGAMAWASTPFSSRCARSLSGSPCVNVTMFVRT